MRRALTRTEVLVTLGILTLAFGLLVSGLAKVRATGAQWGCNNNCRLIGHGLQQHHETHKKFPPGYVSDSDVGGKDTGPGWGWAAHILPYIEQANLYQDIRFARPIEETDPILFRASYLKSFVCSADTVPISLSVGPRNENGMLTSSLNELLSTSYVGNYGDSEPSPSPGTGVFFRNSAVKLGDIADGASSTLMVGERSFKYGEATWVGAVTGSQLSAAPDSGVPITPKHASSYVLGHTGGATEGLRRPLEVNHFSRAHYRGANFLFADGSVRFISRSIDYNTLRALSTRAGGEKELGTY